ncbi:MAG: urease accessory protein UreF [Coleofasciculaceae cyanobacterium SM2_1_6]|nr:urease accessory protein UreF [Coleofasciculaceae cyanobacterium SM2_1_6]
MDETTLLSLLQLASPALPVGAYSYSEGLETLVETGIIKNAATLEHWLTQELTHGVARLEAAVMVRAYQSFAKGDFSQLTYWNQWLTATKETAELREQSWQMGGSLLLLLGEISPEVKPFLVEQESWNLAIASGIAAAAWKIPLTPAVLAYLQSWATNLISAGLKLIPLGQTAGQQLLWSLRPSLVAAVTVVMDLEDAELATSGWGLAIASMAHAHQYSRIFRS